MSPVTDQPPRAPSPSTTDEPPSTDDAQGHQEDGQEDYQGLRTTAQGAAAVGAVTAISSAAAYPVVALAAAEGLGGAAITTNGLWAIGTQFGLGGMTGGLSVLASASAAVTAGAMNLALRDEKTLDPQERAARKVARNATLGLAPFGALGGYASVMLSAAAGTGGAAVVTSGLSVLGGTMATGLALMAAVPCAVVGGGGLIAYGCAKAVEARKARAEAEGTGHQQTAEGAAEGGVEMGPQAGPGSSLNRRAAEALVCAILGLVHPHHGACRDRYPMWDAVVKAYLAIERDEPEPFRQARSVEDIRAIPDGFLARFLRQPKLSPIYLALALDIAQITEAQEYQAGPGSSLNRRAAEALVCAILGLVHPHHGACRDRYPMWDVVVKAYLAIERDEPEPFRQARGVEDIRAIPDGLLARFLRQPKLSPFDLDAALNIAQITEAQE